MLVVLANLASPKSLILISRSSHIKPNDGPRRFWAAWVKRKAKLWPETVQAVKEALAVRPKPCSDEYADRVFLRDSGEPLVCVRQVQDESGQIAVRCDDALGRQFLALLRKLVIHRKNLSFYTIRHTVETHGGADQTAVNMVMGHVDSTMAGNYRHGVADERLEAVSQNLHRWLFGESDNRAGAVTIPFQAAQ
jgi:integrase